MFDETAKVGGFTFKQDSEFEAKIERICELLCMKITEHNEAANVLEEPV